MTLLFFIFFCCSLVVSSESKNLGKECIKTNTSRSCICTKDNVIQCQFMDFTEIPNGKNLDIKHASKLDFSHNSISELNIPFEADELRVLNISYNKIKNISDNYFEHFPDLEVLKLSHNNIENFSNASIFSELLHLKYLDLSYNNLTTLPKGIFKNNEKLEYLNLSNNKLGVFLMSFSDVLSNILGLNSCIRILYMDNLEIYDISNEYFKNYSKLEYLSLVDNPIAKIPVLPKKVKFLDLSGTDVDKLNTNQFNHTQLKILNLNRLHLTVIADCAFCNLPWLKILSMINSIKKLGKLNHTIFGNASQIKRMSLKKWNLAGNELHTLDPNFSMIFDKLSDIDLSNNPLNCSCDSIWLQNYSNHNTEEHTIKCASPKNLEGRKLLELKPEEVCQTESTIETTANSNIIPIAIATKIFFVVTVILVSIVIIVFKVYKQKFKVRNNRNPTRESEKETLQSAENT